MLEEPKESIHSHSAKRSETQLLPVFFIIIHTNTIIFMLLQNQQTAVGMTAYTTTPIHRRKQLEDTLTEETHGKYSTIPP